MDHTTSLETAPFDRSHKSSYQCSIAGLV